MESINPYYNPEKLELEQLSFDEPSLSYEYNTLCFWATKNGEIYTAQDSGCSCPTPFEKYSGEDKNSIIQKLKRIGSVEEALTTFDSWNKDYGNRPYLSIKSREELKNWVFNRIK